MPLSFLFTYVHLIFFVEHTIMKNIFGVYIHEEIVCMILHDSYHVNKCLNKTVE